MKKAVDIEIPEISALYSLKGTDNTTIVTETVTQTQTQTQTETSTVTETQYRPIKDEPVRNSDYHYKVQQRKQFCVNCGAKNIGDNYCSNCGQKFE